MAVVKAPVRQQSYLTEYDKLLAEQLRQMSGSIGPGDIAAESYGGKFPVGTMTAKILGSVLARVADKRAMNREEQAKESYSRAMEIANAMERGNNLSTTNMSVSPEGNLEILPTGAERGGVSTFTRPDILQTQEEIDKLNEIRAKERETTYGPIIERPRIPYVGSEFEATSITPTGIPLAPKNVSLTVGEKIPEDKSAISTFLSGARPQKVLPTNAEQALSQALRGADVNELEFRDYMQNRRMQNRALELAEEERKRNLQPQFKSQKTYYTSTGEPTIVNMFIDPKTGLPLYRGEFNEPIDISPLSPDKPDIEANVLQLNAEQFNAANTELGLNYPEGSVVKLELKKGFNPEGKTIQELYQNATSIDFKEPKKQDIQNIYTGNIPKELNDSLRINIQDSIGVIGQGASLIKRIATIPDAVGIKGRVIRSVAGVAGLIDSVAETDLENALTQYWADADPEELSRVTTDIRQYVAKSISTITGEESGRYTEAERNLAKDTIAAEAALGTPKAVYGALISILSIEERARDRATTALARNKARISGEPIEYANPLLTDEQKISYMKYLQKLGFDKNSAINVIKGIQLDREIAERGGI